MNPDHYYDLRRALAAAEARPDMASAYTVLRQAVADIVSGQPAPREEAP